MRDWTVLVALSPFAGPRRSAERAALQLGRSARTLRRSLQAHGGTSWCEFGVAVGWEWVVERGLSRTGVELQDSRWAPRIASRFPRRQRAVGKAFAI